MQIGQVWSKANIDGLDSSTAYGGRGSVFAVTAQNPGADGIYNTSDDVADAINQIPAWVSFDVNPDSNCLDPMDRIRGFYSLHVTGTNFSFADGSTRFIGESIDPQIYRSLSTINGGEIISGEY